MKKMAIVKNQVNIVNTAKEVEMFIFAIKRPTS